MAVTPEGPTSGATEQIVAMFESYERARAARDRLREQVPEAEMHILNQEADPADTTIAYERNEEGFWGALKRLFVPERDAYSYHEGLRRGLAMLAVTPPPGMRARVVDLLEEYDPVDWDTREAEWRSQGWSEPAGLTAQDSGMSGHGPMGRSERDRPAAEPSATDAVPAEMVPDAVPDIGAPPARPMTGTDPAASRAEPVTGRSEAIPVVEERLVVGKRLVDRGGVRVRSYVVERPVEEDVRLHDERVQVERRPVDRPAGELPEDAFREREIEVTATGEEPVVTKEARVVEEVAVRKDETERTERVRDSVRRTDVEVEDARTARKT